MNPKSFSFFGHTGRTYRCSLNKQRGRWQAAFHDGTKRQRVSLGARTKAEAEIAVKALDAPPPKKEPVRLEWTDFQSKYLTYKTEQGKAPRSVGRFKNSMDAFSRFLQSIDVHVADDVTLLHLEGFIPYRTKTEGCDVTTAHSDAVTIKNAFQWGSKPARGLLKANPALEWETPRPVKPKRRMYTAAEVARLEVGVRPWVRPIVITLAWTGLRIGELLNLRWKDIDFDTNVIHVRAHDGWIPKGRTDRTVPLTPNVAAAIGSQRIGEFVFTGPKGGRITRNGTLAALKKDQERLGMEPGDVHGLRRFFATKMFSLRVKPHIVMQWGGWKDLQTMMRYLADVDFTDSVQAMSEALKQLASA